MLFEFYMYYNTIGPTEFEQAIFSSFLLFNTGNFKIYWDIQDHFYSNDWIFQDDHTLTDKEKIANYYSLFHDLVIDELLKSRTRVDGEDGVSKGGKFFSRDELTVWVNTCCAMLKRLNQEHTRILMEQKQFVQFPDLYAELYNL